MVSKAACAFMRAPAVTHHDKGARKFVEAAEAMLCAEIVAEFLESSGLCNSLRVFETETDLLLAFSSGGRCGLRKRDRGAIASDAGIRCPSERRTLLEQLVPKNPITPHTPRLSLMTPNSSKDSKQQAISNDTQPLEATQRTAEKEGNESPFRTSELEPQSAGIRKSGTLLYLSLESILRQSRRWTPIFTWKVAIPLTLTCIGFCLACTYSVIRIVWNEDGFHSMQRDNARNHGEQMLVALEKQLVTSVSSTKALAALLQLGADVFIEPCEDEVDALGVASKALSENQNQSLTPALEAAKKAAVARLIMKHNQTNFIGVAESLMASYKGITNLQLAPNGIVSIIHPLFGSEGAIGLDLFNTPEQKDGAIKTIQSGSVLIVGPLTLIQNGKAAIIARYPIFIDKADFHGVYAQNQSWWGFATMLVTVEDFLKATPLATLEQSAYSCVVYAKKDGKNIFISADISVPGLPEVLTDDPDTPWLTYAQGHDPEYVSFTIKDLDVHWVMLIWPKRGWQKFSDTFGIQVALGCVAAISSILSIYYYALYVSIMVAVHRVASATSTD